jgi:hypothetical protein
MANTRDLIQNSLNLKLEGPVDGSGSPMLSYDNIHHKPYSPQFGHTLEAHQLDGQSEERWIVPHQETQPQEDGAYPIYLYGYDLTRQYSYRLHVTNA